MRLTLLVLTAAVVSATLLAGCGGAGQRQAAGLEVTAASPTAPYFPLAVGNAWTTRMTTHSSAAASLVLPEGAAVDLPGLTSTSSFKITGTKSIGGAKWFIGGYTPAIPSQEPWYGRHTASGMLIQITDAGTPYYLLKAPIQVGTTWAMPPLNANRTITKVGATTTVPAGTFHQCLVVQQTYTTPALAKLAVKYWFASGTGVVRTEVRDDGALQTTMVLTKATLKP